MYNKEKKALYDKEYFSRKEVKDRRRSYYKNYHAKRRELRNKRDYIKYHNDDVFRLQKLLRARLTLALKGAGYTKKSSLLDITGCTFEFLKNYLTDKFTEGMSWDNKNEWHIDHIIPLASATNEADIIKLSHYTNLQPLWAAENRSKGAKLNYKKYV